MERDRESVSLVTYSLNQEKRRIVPREYQRLFAVPGEQVLIFLRDTDRYKIHQAELFKGLVGGRQLALPAVDDDQIIAAVDEVARSEGLLLCPEGAATYAAWQRAVREGRISKNDRSILFNCATGLKYPMPGAGIPLDRHATINYEAMA